MASSFRWLSIFVTHQLKGMRIPHIVKSNPAFPPVHSFPSSIDPETRALNSPYVYSFPPDPHLKVPVLCQAVSSLTLVAMFRSPLPGPQSENTSTPSFPPMTARYVQLFNPHHFRKVSSLAYGMDALSCLVCGTLCPPSPLDTLRSYLSVRSPHYRS